MATENTKKFKTDIVYSCRSTCDHNCIWSFEIIKRTNKSVWIKNIDNNISRKVISIYNGEEQIFPLGKYSMAPILGANDAH